MRVLLYIVFGLLAAGFWRHLREQFGGRSQSQPRVNGAANERDGRDAQPVVACSVCGLHVPKQDAIVGNRGVYCSVDHRLQSEP